MDENKSSESALGAAATTGDAIASLDIRPGGGVPMLDSQATLSDDTKVPAEIAAVYLGMSPSDLAESHKSKRMDGRAGSDSRKAAGRADKGAKISSPPATYEFGALREMRSKRTAPVALDASSKTGLLDWMTVKTPFFAELEPRVKRGRRVLVGNAWDDTNIERDARFEDVLSGRIRLTWLTGQEATASLWSDEASHRAFAARGLALLQTEAEAIAASIAATKLLG